MEQYLVDLDVLADRLHSVVEEWRREVDVGQLTWRDYEGGWPRPITPDRASVRTPESLGLIVRKRNVDDVLQIVVNTGGWADVASVVGVVRGVQH
ncbi:hypothetical protein G8C93_00025 [Cellulosimicrobium cellulans]|uniref:hypothetical protein n=1 Tax=Cellulosimicrobium cellulans TaxID=1710 RepID=UPI0018840082|nr:hypothetical protein [Cellulosimicrobium cellulans]MBE9924280.1 hypothetical protein [Cellulosimicrobium cellulans]